uniref:Uncharacterized protein n=1 Tax=Arundo donax TaxID=35708 RepID=A0A0A9C1T7_ARUDO
MSKMVKVPEGDTTVVWHACCASRNSKQCARSKLSRAGQRLATPNSLLCLGGGPESQLLATSDDCSFLRLEHISSKTFRLERVSRRELWGRSSN